MVYPKLPSFRAAPLLLLLALASGYAIGEAPAMIVQEASDIHFSPILPYKTIGGSVLLVTMAGIFLHLWFKRRSVERHNAEMSVILNQLQDSEQQLRRSEARYRALFENATDLIYTIDLKGNITSVNAAGEHLTGYTREELTGSNTTLLFSPEHLILAREMKRRKLDGEVSATVFEADFVRKDGRRVPMELNSQLIYEGGVPVGIQIVGRDTSERNRLQKEVHQKRKLEALGCIAGGVAHDFNNILTMIGGYATMLADHPDNQIRADAAGIWKAVDRATALTKQLLAFGRKQVLHSKVVDLNEVIAGMDNVLPRLIREDIFLNTQLERELWPVEADPGQLEQIIVNLVVNARDAMPNGGSLYIQTSNISDCENCRLSANQGSPVVGLIIRDTGCGMDADTLAQIFDPFFTTKAPGQGTGLGLASVYGMVQQSGGHIHVHSELGMGTTFDVHFPRSRRHAERVTKMTACEKGGETILFVEDEPELRGILKYYLTSRGYKAVAAANPLEALELCKTHSGSLDLLLTDVMMPQMNGPTLAQKAAELQPRMKVLYMSGYTDDTIGHDDFLKNNPNFIAKPFTPESLNAKLQECLRS